MKPTITFLAVLLTFSNLVAQSSTSWFTDGAQWRYEYLALDGPGTETIKVEGDTIINGTACKNLKINDVYSRFAYERNDSIFIWDNTSFKLMYDFTRTVGDTIDIALPYLYQKAVVDSIGVAHLYGMDLKFQRVQLIDPVFSYSHGQEQIIYEKIGAPYLFSYEQGSAGFEVFYYLNCYRDDDYPMQTCNASADQSYKPFREAVWSESSFIFFLGLGNNTK